jgi:preprotein translocase subunit SecG
MSNEDNGEGGGREGGIQSNGSSSSNNDHNSIFQIMDGIMNELNKTRKIFVFMFFSMMILPVTAIIIFMYTFDEPRVDRDELQANIQEFNTLSQKLKNQMTTFENLQPDRQEQELQSLLNSEEYKQTINRIDELSQNELELISNEPKTNLYKKEIRLITFILSIIWIILGIRQYIILSNWGKRYNKFKRQQEEIDKKLDSA